MVNKLLFLFAYAGYGYLVYSKVSEVFSGDTDKAYKSLLLSDFKGKMLGKVADKLKYAESNLDFSELERVCKRKRIKIVTYFDRGYPEILKSIHDPPLLLFYKGVLPEGSFNGVGVVGSRRSSFYGLKIAEEISSGLAEAGIWVISGMAAGIDSASHKGAINGGGKTIAVLGTGVDICYPSRNRMLYGKIIENGAVVSEFFPGTEPFPWNFPKRNRIIAGFSKGVVVVEAAKKSGSLITAGLALDSGRDLFAVPASPFNPNGAGTNSLIKDGAYLVTSAKDIIDVLFPEIGCGLAVDKGASEESECLLSYMSDTPVSLDELAAKSGISFGELLVELSKLEISGKVRKEYSGYVAS